MGATKNNTGGTFEKLGGVGKFKYEGAYKISWGGLKNRGGKAFRGPVTEGCLKEFNSSFLLEN